MIQKNKVRNKIADLRRLRVTTTKNSYQKDSLKRSFCLIQRLSSFLSEAFSH